jgi:hypothetical protein
MNTLHISINHFFNPLKPKLGFVIFNYSVRALKKTQHITITKIKWLVLLKKIINVYSEYHMKPINRPAFCGKNAELLVNQVVRASGC